MFKELLENVYDPVDFQKRGHNLIDLLTNHLDNKINEKSVNAINWHSPEEELKFWKDFLSNGNDANLFKEITTRTTYVHHPHCIGHQVTPTAPITALTGMISSLLNNGTAVYEMGMSSNAIERIVTDLICKKIGFSESSRGFLTSGGTLANLTALLSARKAVLEEDVWNEGTQSKIAIMVCEEAHYCVDRAAKIMGLGEKGIIRISASPNFQMNTALLEEKYQEAKANDIQIFAVVGSAPSTSTGMFDNLNEIGAFAEKYKLWFHVDGAHGGAGIFSKKYNHTVAGIHKADSVVIDGHKMMMMPGITTALLFKDGIHANATFSQKADYLLTESEHEDWYNSGKRTFECTKNMMGIHWYTLLKIYGEKVFEAYVTHLYDSGKLFAELIVEDSDFELALKPMSNIVCFRYSPHCIQKTELNSLNEKIRHTLLLNGEFYIVQTKLNGHHYLRVTIMNPFTNQIHFRNLLKKIKDIGNQLSLTDSFN